MMGTMESDETPVDGASDSDDDILRPSYIVRAPYPRYSKRWALNPFVGTDARLPVLEDMEPSWFHRWATHWLLGFIWIDLRPKE